MTFKFIHPTAAQVMRVLSIILTLANTVLVYAATIKPLPGIPDAVAYCWPYIFGAALVIHQLASTFGIAPDAALAAQLNNAMQEGLSVLAAVNTTKAALNASGAPAVLPATTTAPQ